MSDPIREALERLTKAWMALDLHISDGAGYLYDDVSSECVACGEKAPTIAEVKHEPGCFTADREALVAAIALLDKPHPDTERLDWLESAIWSPGIGNGIALFPTFANATGAKRVELQDLGDEDGSNLGEQISSGDGLRAAIDQARGAA